MTLCWFKFFSGLPCPGCGFLHALWAAGQANYFDSFRFYPTWPVVITSLVYRHKRWAIHAGMIAIMGAWIFKLLG